MRISDWSSDVCSSDLAKEIERRGYVNVAQALEANPLFGTSDSSAVGTNQAINGTGQRFVNMFSLGSQRTLTLVNGRRFVSANSAAASGNASAGSQVDLKLIPDRKSTRLNSSN